MDGIVAHTRLDTAVLESRTEEETPFNTLFRLFLLGNPVTPAALEKALGRFPVESLLTGGVVRMAKIGLQANARIDVWEERYVFADFYKGGVALLEHVLGTAEASSCLQKLTVRRAVKSALDVGTGGGCQALLLTTHAEQVVGTDVSFRALNFAAANARLNGIENLQLLRGNFFEPVGDTKFDLVVSNPPFIISPESQFAFRDSGLGGDEVSRRVLEQAAAHLSEGGFATILVNWHHKNLQDWSERPAKWVLNNSCDVLWLRFDTYDPVNYAMTWMRNSQQAESINVREMLDKWLTYYKSLGAGKISFGAVIMRKRGNTKNWKRFDFLDRATAIGVAGDQIQRIFETEDVLRSSSGEDWLLNRSFRITSAISIEQRLLLEEEQWQRTLLQLLLDEGIQYRVAIDEHVMSFLVGLDRGETLREIAVGLAKEMQAEEMAVLKMALAITRSLMQKGVLALC